MLAVLDRPRRHVYRRDRRGARRRAAHRQVAVSSTSTMRQCRVSARFSSRAGARARLSAARAREARHHGRHQRAARAQGRAPTLSPRRASRSARDRLPGAAGAVRSPIRKPALLYSRVLEVSARVGADGDVVVPPRSRGRGPACYGRGRAAASVAIALIHATAFPSPERAVAALAREIGFEQVAASHEVANEAGLGRGETTVVDAYLTPLLRRTSTGRGEDGRCPADVHAVLGRAHRRGALPRAERAALGSGRRRGRRDSPRARGVRARGRLRHGRHLDRRVAARSRRAAAQLRDGGRRTCACARRCCACTRSRRAADRCAASTASASRSAPRARARSRAPSVMDARVRASSRSPTANLALGRVQPDRFPFPLAREPVDAALDAIGAALRGGGREPHARGGGRGLRRGRQREHGAGDRAGVGRARRRSARVRAGGLRRRGRAARVRGGAFARHARRAPAPARRDPVRVGDRRSRARAGTASATRGARRCRIRVVSLPDAVRDAFAELEARGSRGAAREGIAELRSASSGGSTCATSAPRPRSPSRSPRTLDWADAFAREHGTLRLHTVGSRDRDHRRARARVRAWRRPPRVPAVSRCDWRVAQPRRSEPVWFPGAAGSRRRCTGARTSRPGTRSQAPR